MNTSKKISEDWDIYIKSTHAWYETNFIELLIQGSSNLPNLLSSGSSNL
jgi:hypothetical protein